MKYNPLNIAYSSSFFLFDAKHGALYFLFYAH